jgi:F0F1-type ATP synthase assembly protein I
MRDDDRSKINYKKLAGLSSLGLMLPSSIVVGLFIGYYLDKLLGTRDVYGSGRPTGCGTNLTPG